MFCCDVVPNNCTICMLRPRKGGNPILHRLISVAVGRWVTSDPAKLPILHGRKTLYNKTVEKKVLKGKRHHFLSELIIKVQHIYLFHMYEYYEISSAFGELCQSRKWRMWRVASKQAIGGRDICLGIGVIQDWPGATEESPKSKGQQATITMTS